MKYNIWYGTLLCWRKRQRAKNAFFYNVKGLLLPQIEGRLAERKVNLILILMAQLLYLHKTLRGKMLKNENESRRCLNVMA